MRDSRGLPRSGCLVYKKSAAVAADFTSRALSNRQLFASRAFTVGEPLYLRLDFLDQRLDCHGIKGLDIPQSSEALPQTDEA